MTTPIRGLAATVPALLAALLAAVVLLGLLTSPASAAWRSVTQVHGARLQACNATVAGGPAIKFRLDNRDGSHQHRGGLIRNGRLFEVRPARGRVSSVRAVTVRPGDRFETLVGEIDGPAAGGGLARSDLPRC